MRNSISSIIFTAIMMIDVGFIQPATAQNMRHETMLITIGTTQFEVELYDNKATRSLLQILPQTISMSAWGNEFYGRLSKPITHEGDPERDVFEVGEVALWPSGNALCIFFGPTPASSSAGEPRMASPGVPFGKIKGESFTLNGLRGSLSSVRISVK